MRSAVWDRGAALSWLKVQRSLLEKLLELDVAFCYCFSISIKLPWFLLYPYFSKSNKAEVYKYV